MWFHLSKKKWPKNALTELRQTKKGHGEPKVDRFSIAPTVGRAFLACPHAEEGKPLHIYRVDVADPERATDTADFETSGEHLVTEAVLVRHKGSIPVTRIGQVLVEAGERVLLMIALRRWKLDMTHEEEQEILWEVEDDVWRFGGLTQEEAREKLAELRGGKRD
jgi:hypothetical protein